MKGKIFLSLFALPFAGVGLWMLYSVSSTLNDAWNMRSWVAVEATVERGGYETRSGDDSTTYEAFATYRYSRDGQWYTGQRVSTASGGDNIGDYQQTLGGRLGAAANSGTPITVFVDPEAPSRSIVDRSVRWGLVGFKALFVVIFGGVGFGLLYAAWRAPKAKDEADPRFKDTPWLLNDAWQTAEIRSGSKGSMWGAWFFAGIWNAISAPLPFIAWREIVEKENYLILVALLFPLIGIGLLTWAIRRTREWRRFGPTPVTLDPFPGAIGGHVGGTIDLALPFDSRHDFQLTLTNISSYMSGSGDSRSRKESAKWQDSQVAHAEAGGGGTRLTFRFDVPEGLKESDAVRESSYHLWRLNLQAELPGADLDRDFDLPVYPTAEASKNLAKHALDAAQTRQTSLDADAALARMHLTLGSSGRRLFYPMGRHLGGGLGGVVIGAIFSAVGWFLVTQEGHNIFGSIFGGIGALVGLLCFYMIGNSLEVTQAGNGLRSVRRWLGVPISRREMRRDAIVGLEKSSSMQSQSGGKHVMYYSVDALDIEGRKLRLGEGFQGKSEADAAIEIMAREFSLQSASRSEKAPSRARERYNALAEDG